MHKTKISFRLSEKEINKAIKELNAFKHGINRKTDILRKKIAERIADYAKGGFSGAVVDDLIKGGQRLAEVSINVADGENVSVIIANGEDAVWVEFGTGVHHNGSAGSSPHPKGAELGLTIGSYGEGYGKRKVWGFYEDGELKLTHGAPGVMPMYNAVKTVCEDIAAIAREVWG